jgi:apolipoprotein N-acyltransferase
VGAIALVVLVAAQAAYWAGTGALVAAFRRLGLRSPWIVAAVWVLFEYARGRWPLGGFAWNEVGMSLHDLSTARALATLGGVPLVSFLVVLTNGFLADVLRAGRNRTVRSLGLALAGMLVVGAGGALALATRFEPQPTGRVRYALIQGNDQNRRLTADEVLSGYLTRRHLALAERLEGEYDLIVFPESAFETDPEADRTLRARIVRLARRHDSAVLVNAITGPEGNERNTNRLYGPDGGLVGSYSKQHLVPFGEYVPWGGWPRDVIPALDAQVSSDLRPGDRTVVFPVGGHDVGTVICFESAFAPLVRDSVREGAELVIVSTNNRSYRRSALSEQHLATSRMRAAETGRPVLHAAVSGITGVVDAEGEVRRTNPLFRNAVIEGTVTTTDGETPAVRWGPWVVWSSVAILAVALIAGAARRTLSRRAARPPRGARAWRRSENAAAGAAERTERTERTERIGEHA